MSTSALLDSGQSALDREDWASARALFSDVLARRELPEALYDLARVVERDGDFGQAISLYEKAYAAFRARGQSRVPALIAGRELSFLYAAVHGNGAASAGWLERSRRLAEELGDGVEQGWVELAEALMADDVDAEESHTRAAMGIARRFGDADLQSARWATRVAAWCAVGGWRRGCAGSTSRPPRQPAARCGTTWPSGRSTARC